MRLSRVKKGGRIRAQVLAAALVIDGVIGGCAVTANAQDLKIRSPIIEPQELEFENNLKFGGGKNAVHELEYGFTDWLKLGVEAELQGDPGRGFRFDSTAL